MTNMALECLLEFPVETRGDFHLGYLKETLDVFPHFFYFFDKFGWGLTDWFSLQRLQIIITATVTDDHWSPFATAIFILDAVIAYLDARRVDAWYGGEDGISRSCPMCQFERV